MNSTTRSLLAALTLATGIASVTGCTAPAPEGIGSNSSKLLAPQAVFKGPATADTQKVLGISEWRIYRGKTEYVVTGYNAVGKAVKGVAFAFSGSSHSAMAKITGRVLDGSRASGVHEYGGNSSSPSLATLSQTFVDHAFHDLTMLRMGLKTSITRSAVRSGEACSGDLTKIVMSSLQCITSAKATGSSVSKAIKVKQCVAAASSASKAVASCQNVGTTAATASTAAKALATAAPKAPATSSGSGSGSGSKGSSSGSTKSATDDSSKAADQKAADAKQDTEQDAEDAQKEAADKNDDAKTDGTTDAKTAADQAAKDAEKPAADPTDPNKPADPSTDPSTTPADPSTDPSTTPADPSTDPTTKPGNDAGNTVPPDTQVADATTGADAATTASADQTCTSCNGTAATDVQANETTGAVSAANDSAPSDPAPAQDNSSQEPVDTAGDPGGDTTEA